MGNGLVRNGEVISGAVLAALGAYIFLQSRAWDYYTADGPGPGFFPTWYGVAMVALSLALIVNNVMRPKPVGAVDWQAAGRALGTWATFAVAVALMWPLGFVISFLPRVEMVRDQCGFESRVICRRVERNQSALSRSRHPDATSVPRADFLAEKILKLPPDHKNHPTKTGLQSIVDGIV